MHSITRTIPMYILVFLAILTQNNAMRRAFLMRRFCSLPQAISIILRINFYITTIFQRRINAALTQQKDAFRVA